MQTINHFQQHRYTLPRLTKILFAVLTIWIGSSAGIVPVRSASLSPHPDVAFVRSQERRYIFLEISIENRFGQPPAGTPYPCYEATTMGDDFIRYIYKNGNLSLQNLIGGNPDPEIAGLGNWPTGLGFIGIQVLAGNVTSVDTGEHPVYLDRLMPLPSLPINIMGMAGDVFNGLDKVDPDGTATFLFKGQKVPLGVGESWTVSLPFPVPTSPCTVHRTYRLMNHGFLSREKILFPAK